MEILIAIALIAGFIGGSGATVALFFAVKAVAEATGVRPATVKLPKAKYEPPTPPKEGELTFEKQLQNLLGFDGKPQTNEDVTENGD